MPKWKASNLTRHHQKRLDENRGCFEELLGIAGQQMTESQYELRADDAFDNAWGEFEGEARDRRSGEFATLRAYYVDNDLVVAITDGFRKEFVTCYHEHFDRPHGVDPRPGASVGQKQLRYKDRLMMEEQAKFIRNVKRIRGV